MEHYLPTPEFLARHKLTLQRPEFDSEPCLAVKNKNSRLGRRSLFWYSRIGLLVLTWRRIEVFRGYVPSEEALEQIITYTKW